MRRVASLVLASLLAAAPGTAGQPDVLQGRAASIDSATLAIAGRRVRLYGVAAPQMDDWTYGVWARAGLDALLRRLGPLRCRLYGRPEDDAPAAVCLADHRGGATLDLGEWMIRAGYAVARHDPAEAPAVPAELAARYRAAEAAARDARRGFWQGRAGY